MQSQLACDRPAPAKSLFWSTVKRLRATGRIDDEFYLTRTYAVFLRDRWGPERALYWSHRAALLAIRGFGDASGRYAALTTYVGILNELGHHLHALQLLMEIAPLLESEGSDPHTVCGTAAVACVYHDIGDPLMAMSLQLDAVALHNHMDRRPTVQASLHTARAVVLSHHGDFVAALELLDQADNFARRGGSRAQQLATLLSRQGVLAELGLLDHSIADCEAAVRIARQSQSPVWQIRHLNALALGLADAGRLRDLEMCLAAAAQIASRVTHADHLALLAIAQLVAVEARGTPWALLVGLRRTVPAVLSAVSVGMYPNTVGYLMNKGYVGVFVEAIALIMHSLMPICSYAWKFAIYFLDARQCIALREARHQQMMRMRYRHKPRACRWRHTHDQTLFLMPHLAQGISEVRSSHIRALPDQDLSFVQVFRTINDRSMFKPPKRVPRKPPPPIRPMTLADCREIIPDRNTVLLLVSSHGSDLLYVPIGLSPAGEPTILAAPQECCERANAAEALRSWESDCLDAQRHHVDHVFRSASRMTHGDLLRSHGWGSYFVERAAELDLDRLIRVIEPDSKRRQQLHLVLVPDRDTCRIPFHAALMDDQRRLYEHFATCRYAQSLSALRLLGQIDELRRADEARHPVLRGVAFAAPNINFAGQPNRWLDGVIREIHIIREQFGDAAWWIQGNVPGSEDEATLRHFLERHNLGNVLVALGDGNLIDTCVYNDGVKDVVCRMGTFHLADGFLTQYHLQRWPFEFSPVEFTFFSSCVIGRITGASGYEVEGFLAALAVAGCRRVLSALWEISDEAAPEFTRCLMKALKVCAFRTGARDRHSFAKAIRLALDDFRSIHDRKYDHEYFWAPYVLYGLG